MSCKVDLPNLHPLDLVGASCDDTMPGLDFTPPPSPRRTTASCACKDCWYAPEGGTPFCNYCDPLLDPEFRIGGRCGCPCQACDYEEGGWTTSDSAPDGSDVPSDVDLPAVQCPADFVHAPGMGDNNPGDATPCDSANSGLPVSAPWNSSLLVEAQTPGDVQDQCDAALPLLRSVDTTQKIVCVQFRDPSRCQHVVHDEAVF